VQYREYGELRTAVISSMWWRGGHAAWAGRGSRSSGGGGGGGEGRAANGLSNVPDLCALLQDLAAWLYGRWHYFSCAAALRLPTRHACQAVEYAAALTRQLHMR
jgi:hypothetical protein